MTDKLNERTLEDTKVQAENALKRVPYGNNDAMALYNSLNYLLRAYVALEQRVEMQTHYSMQLQRTIEAYCRGRELPYPNLLHAQLLKALAEEEV